MKRKVLFFLIPVLLLLCVLPAWNLAFRKTPPPGGKKESLVERLYSGDLFAGYLQGFLLPLSVSLKPSQVVIGKQGWLFLGDAKCTPLTKHRLGVSVSQRETADAIAEAMRTWDGWFRKNGVKNFRIMICPDKSSIYPEYLPDWIGNPVKSPTPGDLLKERLGESVVYPKEALLREKSSSYRPLYYSKDTHWNVMGAWICYERFFHNFPAGGGGKINTLGHDDVSFSDGRMRFGDLPRLLKLPEIPDESDVVAAIGTPSSVGTERIDWKTGKTLLATSNVPLGLAANPILVRSTGARNRKRVLWIRDSYGTALSPYMLATFDEILQTHYLFTSQKDLVKMTRDFQPDYVFFTVVERQMLADWFTKGPVSDKEIR